jgi:signal transduction histidine kinase
VTRRLVVSYVAIVLVALLALGLPLGWMSARTEREHFEIGLERDAGVIASLVEDQLHAGVTTMAPQIAAQLADLPLVAGGELAIFDRSGRVVHAEDPALGGALIGERPEISTALAGERSVERQRSSLAGRPMVAVTVPVSSGGEILGAVHLAAPLDAVEARVRRGWFGLLAGSLVALVASGLAGGAVARSLSRPLVDVSGAVARFAAGELDVRAPEDRGPREQRALARRFNQMADQLAHLLRAQQTFVSDASHQLRSPLTALRLELEELELTADEGLAAGIRRAVGETHRLSRLVADLLALARADVEVPRLALEDATATLRDRAAAWRPLAAEQGIHLVVEGAAPVMVAVVPGHLAQILDDFLDNAIEASPSGRPITLRTSAMGDRAELHVIDRGRGLDDAARARAFDRFWRGPDARPGTGTGLGLAIARELARLSGGEVDLRDVPGGGTDAVVVLRLATTGGTSVASPTPRGVRS